MRFDSASADRVTAMVLLALGAALTWGGFSMARLEARQIHPASIPGLVPIILGVALMVCAVLLASSAARTARGTPETGSWKSFAFVALWSCVFALSLGGVLPFVVAAAIYVSGFAGWYLIPRAKGTAAQVRSLLIVAIFGAATAAAISALFRYGFLVRLP